MNRRDFLKNSAAASLVATTAGVSASVRKSDTKWNVLYVFSDQHRAASLPGEPYSEVVAPTFERFRRENTSMDRCISNYPLCVPYRGIFMSGLYPQQSHVMGNENSLQPVVPGLGDTFQNAGYHTGYVGKWHLSSGEGQAVPKGPYRFGFEHWQIWLNTNKHYDGVAFNPVSGNRETIPGYQPTGMTNQAIDFLNAQKDAKKPWLLVVSWNPPHPPYNPPPEDQSYYNPAELKLRPNVRLATPEDRPVSPWGALKTMDTLREATQGYYGGITAIDKEFARLLKALADNGQADNTIVIYTSDHGDMMGSHGHMAKQMPQEESSHVPFFIRHPELKMPRKSEALFAAIDIYPTLCGLAGITPPPHCAGRDFSPHIKNKQGFKESDVVFLLNNQGPPNRQEVNTPTYRGLRTKTHTYAVQLDGKWVLYDNVNDPYQMKNMIHDPASEKLIARFNKTLLAWGRSVNDDFPYEKAFGAYSIYPGA